MSEKLMRDIKSHLRLWQMTSTHPTFSKLFKTNFTNRLYQCEHLNEVKSTLQSQGLVNLLTATLHIKYQIKSKRKENFSISMGCLPLKIVIWRISFGVMDLIDNSRLYISHFLRIMLLCICKDGPGSIYFNYCKELLF